MRQAVQDITDINNAIRAYYGTQRISSATAATTATPARMEGVVADQVERMADGAEVITQFGTPIFIGTSNSGGTGYFWPNYYISYTGMRTETCGGLLGALTGPIGVTVTAGTATAVLGAWALNEDHRAEALNSATSIEAFCTAEAGSGETYTVNALYRI